MESFWVITGPILKVFHVKTAGIDYTRTSTATSRAGRAGGARLAAARAIQADLVWGGKIMIDWLVEREKEMDYRPPAPRK